ncbi:MAG: acetolactate synthase small subunit [Verrucomicrobiaceae bacterium]|nr:acetolactate synthase small subunit [Verrucomicrobiaceae bacterium]
MARIITTTDKKPNPRPDIVDGHTLSMYVNNKPGVLMRICQIFARRAYNIDSLVVSQGRDPRFSRLTLGISGDPSGLTQIVLQCDKLIDVIHCFEHTPENSVVRELALIKIKAHNAERRTEILQIVEHFGGKTVDFGEASIIVRIEGASDKVDASIRLLNNYDIVETVRTGKVVMARGEQAT